MIYTRVISLITKDDSTVIELSNSTKIEVLNLHFCEFNLRVNSEINESVFFALERYSSYREPIIYGMGLLTKRYYTSATLLVKIHDKYGYLDSSDDDNIINLFKEQGLIDDKWYAEIYCLEKLDHNWSINKILHALRLKGINEIPLEKDILCDLELPSLIRNIHLQERMVKSAGLKGKEAENFIVHKLVNKGFVHTRIREVLRDEEFDTALWKKDEGIA